MKLGVGVQHFAQGFAGGRPMREGTFISLAISDLDNPLSRSMDARSMSKVLGGRG